MSSMPPSDQPGQERSGGSPGLGGYNVASNMSMARLPIPGNAEFALWLVLEIILILCWIIDDGFDTADWVFATIVLTSAYFISRGIAKASRVLEQ